MQEVYVCRPPRCPQKKNAKNICREKPLPAKKCKQGSSVTTKTNTPNESFDNDSHSQRDSNQSSTPASQLNMLEHIEFDVKPRPKKYNSPQEYSKKLKTELCKNFQLKGKCKFNDTCSFAHGEHELREKVHLHANYKTKKCKQFHQDGVCFYGYRCQYLHYDPCDLTRLAQKWGNTDKYFIEVFQEYPHDHTNGLSLEEQLKRLVLKFERDPNVPIAHLLNSSTRVRLDIFKSMTMPEEENGNKITQ